MSNNTITIYFKPTGDYKEHRYYEQPDAYGQHSGQVVDGYFRQEDIKKDGKYEWAGHHLLFKTYQEADYYASCAIND